MAGTLEKGSVRNWRAWLLVVPTVGVTCWLSRRARGCSPTWLVLATPRGPTSLRRSWDFMPAA